MFFYKKIISICFTENRKENSFLDFIFGIINSKFKSMKKNLLSLGLLMTLTISLNSCALMFNGSMQDVNVKSMTPEAKIYVNGELKGTDAITLKLPRKSNHTVMVKKDGCDTQTTQINTKTQAGWIVFDALFNWFAFLTDAPTGAWNKFDKDNITAELKCTNNNM